MSQTHRPVTVNARTKRSFFAGLFASLLNTVILHPTFTIKSRLQSGEPIPWNVRGLYGGLTSGLVSKLPIEAARVITSNLVRAHVFETDNPSEMEQFYISFSGGFIASSLLFGPSELMIRRQQVMQCSLRVAAQSLYRTRPLVNFMQGSIASAFSGGAYTAAYYAMMPTTKRYLVQKYGLNPFLASMLAGFSCGFSMAFLTHPGDTVKGVQHIKAGNEFVTIRQAISTILQTYSWPGFFRGATARCTRLGLGTIILGEATPRLENWYNEHSSSTLQV